MILTITATQAGRIGIGLWKVDGNNVRNELNMYLDIKGAGYVVSSYSIKAAGYVVSSYSIKEAGYLVSSYSIDARLTELISQFYRIIVFHHFIFPFIF